MNDNELTEKAARALGFFKVPGGGFEPLESNSMAFHIMMKLGISVDVQQHRMNFSCMGGFRGSSYRTRE